MPIINPSTGPQMPAFACTLVGSAEQFEGLRSTLRWSCRQITAQMVEPVGQGRLLADLDRFLAQLDLLQAVTVSEV